MKVYSTKQQAVLAMQFDGGYSTGKEIKLLFPEIHILIEYDYNRGAVHKLKVLIGNRFMEVVKSDYLVKGALGEVFIYRENLFHAMFDPVYEEP
jgi:hypothetical protein